MSTYSFSLMIPFDDRYNLKDMWLISSHKLSRSIPFLLVKVLIWLLNLNGASLCTHLHILVRVIYICYHNIIFSYQYSYINVLFDEYLRKWKNFLLKNFLWWNKCYQWISEEDCYNYLKIKHILCIMWEIML